VQNSAKQLLTSGTGPPRAIADVIFGAANVPHDPERTVNAVVDMGTVEFPSRLPAQKYYTTRLCKDP
jgi:hypothetical protein